MKHGLKNIFTVYFADEGSMREFEEKTTKGRHFSPETQGSEDVNIIQNIDRKNCSCSISVDDRNINSFIRSLAAFRIRGFKEHSVSLEEFFMHFYKNDRVFALE